MLSKMHNSGGQRTAFQFSAHQITRRAATAYITAHFGYSCCIPGGELHANLMLMGTGYTTALVGEKSPCYASGCCFSKLTFEQRFLPLAGPDEHLQAPEHGAMLLWKEAVKKGELICKALHFSQHCLFTIISIHFS